MPLTLGSNISSLRSQRRLSQSSEQLGLVFERLSSGQRINKASDDAAGLAIADNLRTDSRVYTQGIRNLNDGLSVLNIADGALSELSGITTRLLELAEQSANGVFSKSQRESLNAEAQALKDEFFRISKSTEFNDRVLFSGSYGELRLQAGYGAEGSIVNGLGGAIGTGQLEDASTYTVASGTSDVTTGDFNGDGHSDLVIANSGSDNVSILLGNGSGGFGSATDYSVGNNPRSVDTGDFNNDGILDLVTSDNSDNTVSILLGNGNGTFGTNATFSIGNGSQSATVGDVNNDGNLDIVSGNSTDSTVSVLLGQGDGSFATAISYAAGIQASSVVIGDFNNDGVTDLATRATSAISILLGQGSGSFGSASTFTVAGVGIGEAELVAGDFNNDGALDLAANKGDLPGSISIFLGQGDATFGAAISVSTGAARPDDLATGDFNGDGILDIISANAWSTQVSVLIGQGNGQFDASTYSAGTGENVAADDFNGDGVLDVVTIADSGTSAFVLLGSTADGVAPLLDFSLETQAYALQALPIFSRKLNSIAEQRGQIGAFMARVSTARDVLTVSTENYTSAEGRIRDVDVSQESANLTRLNLLQQASAAVLAQANQQPAVALQLLQQS